MVVLGPSVFSRVVSPWRCVSVHATADDGVAMPPDTQLRIACYNIAHGRGLAVSNWGGGDRAARSARLDQIAELLRTMDADVVVLNEVDFDSSWSNSVNQAQYLAEKAGYAYRVEQRNLDARFLVWTWRYGNVVLSRYPIVHAEVVDLPGYARWETVLAGKKRSVICDIEFGDRTVRVIGAHLSHRSESVRVRSAVALTDIAAGTPLPTLIAGDLNASPPGFPGSQTDAAGENAVAIFDNSGRFRRWAMGPPVAEEYLTFHAARPRRVIDWVLIPDAWRFVDYHVEMWQLSDHRPVYADVAFGKSSVAPEAKP